MLHVERFVNELMSSNCYIIWDDTLLRCLVVDPASEKSRQEIEFIEKNNLILDYIILTHEHTDHTWGANALIDAFSPIVVCSQACKEALPKEGQMYFRLYYDDTDYSYNVQRVDKTIEEIDYRLDWCDKTIWFYSTPGHSAGSMCFSIDGLLFSGDTIQETKPYINKKNGNLALYVESINKIMSQFSGDTTTYPGHGEQFQLKKSYRYGN